MSRAYPKLERPRGARAIAIGVASTVFGLILSLFGDPAVGSGLCVLGVLLSIFGLHRLGRSGPDPEAITVAQLHARRNEG